MKAVIRGKLIALSAYTKTLGRSHTSNLATLESLRTRRNHTQEEKAGNNQPRAENNEIQTNNTKNQ